MPTKLRYWNDKSVIGTNLPIVAEPLADRSSADRVPFVAVLIIVAVVATRQALGRSRS